MKLFEEVLESILSLSNPLIKIVEKYEQNKIIYLVAIIGVTLLFVGIIFVVVVLPIIMIS